MAVNFQKGLFRVYKVLDVIIFIISIIIISEESRLYWSVDDVLDEWPYYLLAILGSFFFCAIPWGIHYLVKWMIKGFFDDKNKSDHSPEEESEIQSSDNVKATPIEYLELAQKEDGTPFIWRRFWARVIDFSCISVLSDFSILLIMAFVISAFPSVEEKIGSIVSANPASYFFMILGGFILSILILIIYEALFLTLFGTTIGKALFGMRVKNKDGSKLNFGTAFSRSSHAYASGLWFLLGFPALSIWPLLRSLSFIRQNHETVWDKSCGTTLFMKRIWIFRALIMSFIGFCCFFGYFGLRILAKEEAKKTLRDSYVDLAIERHLEYIENQLTTIALETNKELPKMLSSDLRLDKLVSHGDRTLEYIYTIIPDPFFDMKFSNPTLLKNRFKPSCLENIKTAEGLETLKNNSVSFVYTYLDQKGHEIVSFTISPEDYKDQ